MQQILPRPGGHAFRKGRGPFSRAANVAAFDGVFENAATREQLEERMYGWNEEIESNAIPVHIYNLRRKLGTEAIRNVRGVGYRIGDIG